MGLFLILMMLFSKSAVFGREYCQGLISCSLNQLHHFCRKFPLFHALAKLLADRKCPKDLPSLDNIEKVSDRCYRILGLNPGDHTLQGSNTWLIGCGENKILVDTGEDITARAYVDLLVHTAMPLTGTKRLSVILLTHGHGN